MISQEELVMLDNALNITGPDPSKHADTIGLDWCWFGNEIVDLSVPAVSSVIKDCVDPWLAMLVKPSFCTKEGL